MTWEIEIEHVGGILEGNATLEPGLNAVRASNWQGKSSFVEAIKAGLGVSTALTEGRSEGRVTMETPERNVDVGLRREGEAVSREGTPYLTDEYDRRRTALFACPDETNEVRRAVRAGENLEEVLLAPLDLENLDERIADIRREREQVDAELEQATEARKRLPTVAEKVSRLESDLADLRERREQLGGPVGEAGGDQDGGSEGAGRTDDSGGPDASGSTGASGGRDTGDDQHALARAQSERDQAAQRLERLERSIERREATLAEKREALADLDVPEVDDVEAEHEEAREELAAIKREVEVLQSVHSANDLVLSENRLDTVTDVERELTGDRVACWTCGSEAPRSALADQLEAVGERLTRRRGAMETARERVEELEARLEEAAQARTRQRDLETAIADLEDDLADKRESLAESRERRERAADRIDALAERVDEAVADLADVESDIRYREAELADAREERESLESRAARVEQLREERASLQADLEDLRTRREAVMRETREAFDDALGDVLARFDAGFETARLTADFDLVVARNGREARLDALSEGELELLGFVAALAGFEAFDVADTVPVMLVDGVGGLAEANLRRLVEYLEERTEYLVFTAYPEFDAVEGTEIDPADWRVTSSASDGEG